ncbi:dTDP-4-dehydrorhamnose reductase [Thioalkalivibrio nitratireducens DSM 14787]|uniref:dTDP-4-dehydrorhamnose reductase n=1 Tax=Thioalkalivibrio nitratireducens (strain DSM 14787 / UNIQEM 213 / ALEN2) TaxID=1255043 RepID=L0DZ00_THIND|nr:dTDP-4-dehydrorhamnose reductase [Thioalkalivibrio nitratireducens]AGA33591.1 dTDP-4-dehydrorhamnose reductase [Thioalkalivibrio nitratireducens DSM 14787]
MAAAARRRTRVLLTGADGQLGRALQACAGDRFEWLAFNRRSLDITQAAAVTAAVAGSRPDWIVNAAAYTAVDRAETDRDAAFAINAEGAAHLARAAARSGARMAQVSTDYVFDGTAARPYRPDDTTGPLNVYGSSKLAGETFTRDILGDRALIVRTSWVYAAEGHNFLRTMLKLLRERDTLRVVEDQIGTPTHAASLAAAVVASIEHQGSGIHHWTDAGVASWYDFAVAIQEEALRNGFDVAGCRVEPIPTREYPTPAARPPCSLLDKDSLRALTGNDGRHWREELRLSFKALGPA